MKRWIATMSIALALLCGWPGQEASAQQERPIWRDAKQREQVRKQREQAQEERRQGRERVREERQHEREHIQEERRQERRELQQHQEQIRERGEEARRPQRETGEKQDRALNRDEAQRHFPHLGKRFDEIDSNHDGVITQDEVRAFRQSRARARVWGGDGGDPRD
jgi:hypothetical protein